MNKNTIKTVFVTISLMLSLVCFIYVNVESKTNPPVSVQETKELAPQKTSMPDMKIIKGIVDIVSNFLTAK